MTSGIARGRVSEWRSRVTWRPYSSWWVDRGIQPWFTAYIFDIGNPCYGQLTAVKIRHLLTISWPYHVTILRAQVQSSSRSCVYLSWPLPRYWFAIGSMSSTISISLTRPNNMFLRVLVNKIRISAGQCTSLLLLKFGMQSCFRVLTTKWMLKSSNSFYFGKYREGQFGVT